MSARKPPPTHADRVAALVAERDRLLELRAVVAAAPRPFAEAAPDLAAAVAALATRVAPAVASVAQSPAGAIDLAHNLATISETAPVIAGGGRALTFVPAGPSAFAVAAWLFPDALTAALGRELEAAYRALPSPLPGAERLAELTRLDAQIAGKEREAAEAWWSALDAGQPLPPPEVSAWALLGVDPP